MFVRANYELYGQINGNRRGTCQLPIFADLSVDRQYADGNSFRAAKGTLSALQMNIYDLLNNLEILETSKNGKKNATGNEVRII